MKISNSEEANFYYNHIHTLLKKYTDEWGISPINLRKYFKKGSVKFKNFLESNNLSEIVGIDIVFNDILDDMKSFEKEHIMKFESFNDSKKEDSSLKTTFLLGVKDSDLAMEKFLADHFDTNLSNIILLSQKKHFFSVQDWDIEKMVYVFDEDDMDIISKNINNHFFNKVSNKNLILVDDLSISMKNLISFEDFSKKIEEIIGRDKEIQIISSLISSKFMGKFEKYFIWKTNI